MSETNSNLPAQQSETGNAIAKASDHARFPVVDLDTAQEMPDLDAAEVMPLELTSTYWEPEAPGECKRVVFSHIDVVPMQARNAPTGEMANVPTAFFYEKKKDKDGTESVVLLRNGSKLLVSGIQDNMIQRGTPLQIVYVGKKAFKNGNKGDDWSIKPLLLKIS